MTGFIGFGDGDNVGMLPYSWYGSSFEGWVEELGEVVEPPWAQMFQVPNCEAIWAPGRRVSSPSDGLRHHVGGERACLGG